MTPKKDLKARNRAAIKEAMPEALEWLDHIPPKGKLTFDADGRPDVLIGGRPAFGKPYHEHLAEQMQAFRASERRIGGTRPEPGNFDEYTNRFLRTVLNRASADGIAFEPTFAGHESHFLIVLGPGLGGQLDELVEETNCQSVIVADRTPEMLHHALETYDWHRLWERIRAAGGRLMIMFADTAQELSQKVAVGIRTVNPCAFDGATVYVDRSDPFLVETIQHFVQRDHVLVTGSLGFFNDESLMLRNAHRNFQSGQAIVFHRTDERTVETPFFIVASGPSVDAAIPHIKANADKAFIVSCGTGLKPLLANGIVPDFHVESENLSVSPVLGDVSKTTDISSICFVAASTVECDATEYFDRTIHYFRPGLSPFPLYCDTDRYCLRSPSPNVANAAFSFAQDCGARSIYLFGVDLGVRDMTGRHHSEHSYYYGDDVIFDAADLEYSGEVDANFGGKAHTSAHLYMAGQQLAMAVTMFGGGNRYFNCSDGAAIAGFEPLRAEKIKLTPIAGGKEAAVDTLIESFPVYTKAQFDAAWDAKGLEAEINAYLDEFLAKAEAIADGAGSAYLTPLVRMLHPEDFLQAADLERLRYTATLFLRGSLFTMLATAEYYFNRIADPAARAKAGRIVVDEMAAVIEILRERALDTVRHPEDIPVTPSSPTGDAIDVIPEAPPTWGKVARNAPCPCGSGKRYKNCHGAL